MFVPSHHQWNKRTNSKRPSLLLLTASGAMLLLICLSYVHPPHGHPASRALWAAFSSASLASLTLRPHRAMLQGAATNVAARHTSLCCGSLRPAWAESQKIVAFGDLVDLEKAQPKHWKMISICNHGTKRAPASRLLYIDVYSWWWCYVFTFPGNNGLCSETYGIPVFL